MDTAVQLVLSKGYDAVGVRDITDKADIGRGTFYIHFKDKEDVVWSAIKEGLDKAHQEGMREMVNHPPERHMELQVFANFFTLVEKNKDLYRVILGSRGSSALSARAMEYLVSDLLKEEAGLSLSPVPGVPRLVWAQIAAGAIFRLVSWWLEPASGQAAVARKYTSEQMAAMLHKTLYGKK